MTVRTFGIAGATETAESFRLAASGMWVPASAINTRTGVTSVPVLTGTGAFTCTVSPFTMVIDGTSNSLQGSYPVALDTTTLVTITAADVAARTDLICVQIQDNAYDASGFNRGQILYVKGTSGGGIPSTPANSIVLWQVPVGASASSVTFGSATAVFPYTAAAGGIVPARNSSDKPAAVNAVQYRHRLDVTATSGGTTPLESSTDGITWTPVWDATAALGKLPNYTSSTRPGSPATGLAIYETDTGNVSVWNGTAWLTVFVAQTAVSPTLAGTFTGTVTIQKVGNRVFFTGAPVAPSATWTAGANITCLTLPAGYIPSVDRYIGGAVYSNGAPIAASFAATHSGFLTFQITTTVTAAMQVDLDGICYAL